LKKNSLVFAQFTLLNQSDYDARDILGAKRVILDVDIEGTQQTVKVDGELFTGAVFLSQLEPLLLYQKKF